MLLASRLEEKFVSDFDKAVVEAINNLGAGKFVVYKSAGEIPVVFNHAKLVEVVSIFIRKFNSGGE